MLFVYASQSIIENEFLAKYGNPYLRESSTLFDQTLPPPPQHLLLQQSPLATRGQFSTMNPRHSTSFDGYNAQVPNFGTLPYKPPHNLPFISEQPISGAVPAHYIQTQDGLQNS